MLRTPSTTASKMSGSLIGLEDNREAAMTERMANAADEVGVLPAIRADQDSQWNDEMPALLEHRADRFSFPFPGSCQTEPFGLDADKVGHGQKVKRGWQG